MKPNKLILSAILSMAFVAQPALADSPKYIFQYAKKGVKVTETGSTPVNPGTPGNPGTPSNPDTSNPGTNPGTPVVEKVELSHQAMTFDGAWVSGPTVTKHVTVTNMSDQQMSFTFDVTGSTSFTATSGCASLAPGAACDVQIVFAPTDAAAQSASLRVASADGTTKSVQLTGTGRSPSVTLSTPTFANAVFPSNTDVTAVARLTNNSYQQLTVNTINSRTAFSPLGQFSLVGTTCPPTMNPETSCDVTLRLVTTTSGPRNATLNVTTSAGKLSAPLSGMVIGGTASLSAPALNFNSQAIDVTSAPQSVQLTNTGNAVLNVSSMSFATNADSFGRSNTCGTPLQPGESCMISVAFTPKNSGYIQGELMIVHDGNGQINLSAYGTGAYPPDVSSFNFGYSPALSGSSVSFQGASQAGVTTALSCEGPATFTKQGEDAYIVQTTAAGTVTCTLTATNSAGSSEITRTLEVGDMPQITSFNTPSELFVNQPGTITWTTKGAASAEVKCTNGVTVTNGQGLQGTATIFSDKELGMVTCSVFAKGSLGHEVSIGSGFRVVNSN